MCAALRPWLERPRSSSRKTRPRQGSTNACSISRRKSAPGFSRFDSVIEVVGRDDGERLAARERVKFYKDRGYTIQYFDLAEKS